MVIVGLIVLGAIVNAFDAESGGDSSEGSAVASGCRQPADSWIDTLQSAFYPDYQSAGITSSAYVVADTSEGEAYYVAVEVDGVSGVAVFGTSDPPLQSDPGLIAAANSAASRASKPGITTSAAN
jgi:hypothetical protein